MNHKIIVPVLLAIFALGVFGAWAQTTDYSFATTNGTYTPITGGILLGTETSDDQRFVDPAIPAGGTTTTGPGFDIGFNFLFNGVAFDRLAINNNGWISLGQSALTPSVNNASTSGYTPLSSTITTINPPELYNRIAGLGRDLQAQVGASLRLETIGNAPNRVCIVQFENYKKYGTTGTGDSFSFQIQLHETSNNVAIVYGSFTSNATAGNMQVGLRGPDQSDYFSRTGSTGWDNTSASTAFTQYVVLSDVYYPANGLTFTFGYPLAVPNDLMGVSLTGNPTPTAGTASNYIINIRNRGSAAQTAYQVKLYRGAAIEVGSVPGTTIQPGETLSFTIPWTPAAEGPEVLYGKVVLPGDANTANDETASLNVTVMPAGVTAVTVGDGNLRQGVPLEFYYKNSLHQALYFQDELNMFGNITALTFYNDFVTDLPNKPCTFWLGLTDLENLSGGWILDGLTQVFSGTVNFPAGQNIITIPLQTPFAYTGGNLVLYAHRPMDDLAHNTADDFLAQTVGTNRARKLQSSTTTYDPLAPATGTLSGTFAKTTFIMTPLSPDPLFTISPPSYDFGLVLMNTPVERTFSIGNAGGGTLTINSISLPANAHFSLQNLPNLPVSLATGQIATFVVRYQPTAAGTHNATVTITDNRMTHTVAVTGNSIDGTVYTLPYAQNWDAVTAPALPVEWTSIVQSTVTTSLVVTSTTSPFSAPNSARLYNGADTAANIILVGPQIGPALNVNNIRVKFQGKGSASYHLFVGVMTDPTDPATFEMVHDLNVVANWNEYVVSLAGYTGTGRYIAFKHGCAGSSQSLYVDDVSFELIAPNDLASTGLTGNVTPSVETPTTYTASIYNWGTVTQSNYTVKLYNGENVELATAAGVTIAPDTTEEVPLTWTPTAEGPVVLYAKVILTGDVNPTNDQSPNLNITVQPAGVIAVTVGDGNLRQGVPLEFYYKNSLHQALYYQSEINMLGNITALTFYNDFVTDLPNMPCTFWLGQTDLENLSGGWILDGLTQVFSGNISFPAGENVITIPLQTPFPYTGGNLVLYAHRPMDALDYNTADDFQAQTVGTNRARKLQSDTTTYNPMAPTTGTLSGTFAKTTFIMSPLSPDPLFTISPTSFDFGLVLMNTPVQRTFSIGNAGGGTLTINSISLPANAHFSLQNLPTLPVSLVTGQTVTFVVRYLPTAAGTHNATITITDNRMTHTVAVTGNSIDATIYTLPYAQNFDAVTAPALPVDWTSIVQSTVTTSLVVTSTTSPFSAPNSARLYNGADTAANIILVGPQIGPALDVNNIRVRFQGKGSATYHLFVGVMTNPNDPATFELVSDLNVIANWNEYIVSLTGYTGEGRYIAFKHGCAGNSQSLYVDDVSFELIAPNDLATTHLTGNTTPSVGSATVYTATIFNWGTATQSNYTVKLFNGSNVELASMPGTTIGPDATVQIPLSWTPTVEGPVVLYAKVILTGDINPANDQSPNLNVLVMGAGTLVVSIGNGTTTNTTTGVPTPYGTYYKNFHQQYLYTAAEMFAAGAAPGLITSIGFNVAAVNNCSPMPNYTIKVKSTQQTALTTTFEVGDYNQVWYQNDFVPVEGWNTHAFTAPFFWDGASNILVDIITTMIPTAFTQNASVYYTPTTGTNTSLRYQSDTVDASTSATGTVSVNRANIRISMSIVGMASLNGTVTSGGNPVEGVNVTINNTIYHTTTNTLGQYNFPYVIPGDYTVTATKIAYESQTIAVTLEADVTTTLNFNLIASTAVTVSGQVVGSDQPTVGLADATITLSGILNYEGTTNAQGNFSIPNVLSGNTYGYQIVKEGYQNLTGSVTVPSTNHNMGILILSEIALPPSQVIATENVAQTQVSITWNSPQAAPPMMDFETDDGEWIPTSNWADPLGDFEWTNTYNVANYVVGGYPTSEMPPPTAHSGTGLWGTNIYAPYTNSAGFSYLTKEFNFTGIANPQMRFWSWNNSFGNWDYGQVSVNGTVVWGPAWDVNPVEWEEIVIDLTAYANMPVVTIQFQHYATAVVNYAGWYIDDVYIGAAQTRTSTPTASVMPEYLIGLSELEAAALMETRPSLAAQSNPQPTQERILMGYRVYRLLAANQDNESTWTLLTPTPVADTTYIYLDWAPLPSGVYKFAVKAEYTNGVLSAPALSNEIHKGMMGVLSGTVTEFGTGVAIGGATITAGTYNGTSATDGTYSFLVYAGTYDVTAARPGYQSSTQTGVVLVGTQTTILNFILTEITLPPGAVQATEVSPSLVNLTWMEPGTAGGEWLHYDSGQNNDSIGTNAAADFDVAIRYPASALANYAGMSLYAVKAWPAQAGTFSIRVWTGGTAAAPATMVVDQPFTPILDTYNTVLLNTPVTITGTEELWFGYRCNVTGGYPAGCDAGPAHDGFGNMMYYQSAWQTLLNLAPTLNYDWNIQGYAGYSAPMVAPMPTPISTLAFIGNEDRISQGMLSTRLGRPGASAPGKVMYSSVANEDNGSYSNNRTLNGYRVWRLLQGQETNEAAWTSLTPNPITATAFPDNGWGGVTDGTYKWAVKAVYTGGALSIPAFSNPLEKLTQIGTIAGIVRNMQNAPIMGATVVSGNTSATTNASGAYSMMLGSGTHSVTASHPLYASITHNGVIVVTGQTTTVNFQLPASENLFVDGFESYTNFALTFAPWTTVDVDGSNTYTMTGTTWLNGGTPQAFIIFNPTATTPPSTTITAHGGVKMAACIAATAPPNNDWLITPVLTGTGRTLRFWAKSLTADYGLERFHVAVSTTGTAPDDFTVISGPNYIQAPVAWTEYSYSLAAYGGPIYVGIHCVSNDAWMFFVDDVSVVGTVPNDDPNVPVIVTELRSNFPNPFNPETTISYSLKEAGPVTVQIYNLKGQLVKTLVNEAKDAGQHTVIWNGKDNNGNAAASGVYFYKMNTGKYSSTKKMIMMK